MKKAFNINILAIAVIVLTMILNVSACSKNEIRKNNQEIMSNQKLKITVGEKVLIANLEDNATTRALISKLPLTLPMKDLYEREVVYRFPESLPSDGEKTGGYKVGDISYWSPRHSFVIFYKQNGEVISNLQKVGHLESGVEIFETTGDVEVKFELSEK